MSGGKLSTIVSTAISSVVVLALRAQVSDAHLQTTTVLLLTYAGLVIVVILVMVFVHTVPAWVYSRSKQVRFLLNRVAGRPYIEGYWVDVGIEDSGGLRRIKNYSFYTIQYFEGVYQIEGRSWDIASGVYTDWAQVRTEFDAKRRRLDIWYREEQGNPDRASSAFYNFRGRSHWVQDSVDGEYQGVIKTAGERVALASFLATGGLLERRLKQEGLGVEWEKSHGMAKAFLKRYGDRENMPMPDYEFRHPTSRQLATYATWYRTFLKYSDNKRAERELVERALSDRQLGNVACILDIGPGDGSLTELVVSHIFRRGVRAQYVAVEPNTAFLDMVIGAVRSKVQAEPLLRVQRIQAFLEEKGDIVFDLVLAFHSLYFADNIEMLVKELRAPQVGMGPQVLLALHTDVAGDPLLARLIKEGDPQFKTDVVSELERAAQQHHFRLEYSKEGTLALRLPEVDDNGWQALRSSGRYEASEKLLDTANIACFLANQSVDELKRKCTWVKILDAIRESAMRNPEIQMRMRFQWFIREPLSNVATTSSEVNDG